MYKAVVHYKHDNKIEYANIIANRLEYTNTHLYVFHNSDLVGIFLIEKIVDAHLSEVKQ
jgi:hypothetical protein